MSSKGFRSLPLVSGNTKLGHPTASTRATSPANTVDPFFLEEDSCAYLARFETVVLVDDTISMSGWSQVSDLLAEMTEVVTNFNPDGFELHFVAQADYDLKHATTPELIRGLFATVAPSLYLWSSVHILERELSKYISRYRENSELRGLNLLVVTGSFPYNEDQISEEILEVISHASKEMEILRAGKEKISIQFIQIRPTRASQTFLERLHDAYVVGIPSGSIIVSTIPWDPEEKHPLLEKVLFGGIRQHWDDQAYEYLYAYPFETSRQVSKLAERIMYQLGTRSIRQVLLAALTHRSPWTALGEQQYRTTFDLTWELLAFVRDHLGDGEKLSQVITLTGTQVDAQASTCEQYIREFWPNLGPWLLSSIEDVCDQCLRQQEVWTSKFFHGHPHVSVKIIMNSNKTTIEVLSSLAGQIEVTEILAWLTAAIRSSTPPSLSNSKAGLTFEDNMSHSSLASFKLQPKPLYPIKDGSQLCWHPLFERSVIAVQFPYIRRTQGVGVELSPFLMAILAGIRTAVEFRGGLILRGLSTALIPLKMTEGKDAIQWHLATTNTSDDALTTDLLTDLDEIEGIDGYYKVQDVQQLCAKKAYLGWCSVTTVLLGTQDAKYQEVTWSDPAKVGKNIEFSGVSLSLGSAGLGFGGPTATANFVIPKTQRTHFMDVENQLKVRLNISITRSVIVYDTLDRRGWMVPIVCLMLYMMHVRVRKLPKPPEASEDGLTAMPYSTGEGEAGREAYEILTKYMEPDFASTLGNSENWKDTLALFYIALNTFFGKSKELSSRSSASHSSDISGFELMDAALAENPFRYNSRQIQSNSGGWAQLGDIVGILFCKGIGDAIMPGVGANILCRPWSSVPSRFDYLGAYIPCVIEVLSRQGRHRGSNRLRQRTDYDLYKTCDHAENARCSHLQTYGQIADPPDNEERCISPVTGNEEPPSAENLLSHRGAIIFGKRTTLVKPWPAT